MSPGSGQRSSYAKASGSGVPSHAGCTWINARTEHQVERPGGPCLKKSQILWSLFHPLVQRQSFDQDRLRGCLGESFYVSLILSRLLTGRVPLLRKVSQTGVLL